MAAITLVGNGASSSFSRTGPDGPPGGPNWPPGSARAMVRRTMTFPKVVDDSPRHKPVWDASAHAHSLDQVQTRRTCAARRAPDRGAGTATGGAPRAFMAEHQPAIALLKSPR